MAFTPQWEEVQPQNRWQILRRQKRFALWALYSSIGSFMLGRSYRLAARLFAAVVFARREALRTDLDRVRLWNCRDDNGFPSVSERFWDRMAQSTVGIFDTCRVAKRMVWSYKRRRSLRSPDCWLLDREGREKAYDGDRRHHRRRRNCHAGCQRRVEAFPGRATSQR